MRNNMGYVVAIVSLGIAVILVIAYGMSPPYALVATADGYVVRVEAILDNKSRCDRLAMRLLLRKRSTDTLEYICIKAD